jgi:hypothetical protein
MKPFWRNLTLVGIALVFTGCVHVNEYLTKGRFAPENKNYEIGLRPATTTNPRSSQKSWGTANTPGATGFVLSVRSTDFKTPVTISNLLVTYSTKGGTQGQFVVVTKTNDSNHSNQFYYDEFYLIPMSSLTAVNYPTIKQIIRLGHYSIDLSCEINGQTNHFTGEFDYFHKSNWQKAKLGWQD